MTLKIIGTYNKVTNVYINNGRDAQKCKGKVF